MEGKITKKNVNWFFQKLQKKILLWLCGKKPFFLKMFWLLRYLLGWWGTSVFSKSVREKVRSAMENLVISALLMLPNNTKS